MKNKWYNNGDVEIYIGANDLIPDGFTPGRLSKIVDLQKQISKEELYREYIINNTPFNLVFQKFGITRKDLRRLLTLYGIKKNQTNKKSGSNQDLTTKQHETREKRWEEQKKKLCRTIAEQKLYDLLIQHYSDLRYDVKVDDRYPFYCDFYIPSLDMFIELQAHPSHGRLPIEMMSVDEYSTFNKKWVDVFARRDVCKKQYADKNNLNFIRIYPRASLNENYIINKNLNKEIIDICYKSQH